MITRDMLCDLLETLSCSRPDGRLSLREFGEMLGKAAGRYPYSRSYISHLLRGTFPITPRVAEAARILMLGVAGIDNRPWSDPFPVFSGSPVEKLMQAKKAEIPWQEMYVQDANVRSFVDALVDLITRGSTTPD